VNSPRNLDIVVDGATGFTGQLDVEYIATYYGNDKKLRWAMAGRSLAMGDHLIKRLVEYAGLTFQVEV
jgi:short subunit dehydrogenase-like uncharacterized protein